MTQYSFGAFSPFFHNAVPVRLSPSSVSFHIIVPSVLLFVSAVKISLEDAIAAALKKVPGKAVYADFDVDEKGPPEAEVKVFAEGKVTSVLIHAVTGEVLKVEPKK